jgi:formamidopyrimidine-DNA glycosylase
MPELPEVETVRRGLAPVMEGARFIEVVAHRGDLRWPLPKDFAARLKGETVTGLGRRAKYLLADLSSGDVLVMHLGMSGSFRVEHDGGGVTPGAFRHERS